ncbi:hemerythrin domain-containing protein [Microbacterium sp. TWP3-1-2b2]|uniref:hemerythrin domain-containing protein n=1 Tax=Microbacterium sp. TWP3-1-2b2 TaxID=2804651 RepID=UPI003CEF97A7
MHTTLREALQVTRRAVADGEPGTTAARDLLLYCHGFCVALDGHHRSEDRVLFPSIERAHPQLAPVLRQLEQDHSMIAHLLGGLQSAVDSRAAPDELDRHLEGVAAIMESHFRYEERQLLIVLEALDLDATPTEALGSF